MVLENFFTKSFFDRAKALSGHNDKEFLDFKEKPFPTTKDEDWKFTTLAESDFDNAKPLDFEFKPAIVAENCSFSFNVPKIEWTASDKMEASIKAFHHSGFRAVLKENLKGKLHAVFMPKGSAQCFNAIELEKNSTLDYFEEFSSESEKIFFGSKTIFLLGENSVLNYYSVQKFGENTISLINKEFRLLENSKANTVQAELGGKISRMKIDEYFNGNNSSSGVHKTLFFGTGKQHFDISTNAFHHGIGTKSDIMVKGALKGNASSVYRGLIKIDQNARETDSFLQDRVLHLSKGVKSNSIPSLKIDNNDVKASHGATISKLSEETLFYLASRGIPRETAQTIAVEGFLNDVTKSVLEEKLKEKITELIEQKIAGEKNEF